MIVAVPVEAIRKKAKEEERARIAVLLALAANKEKKSLHDGMRRAAKIVAALRDEQGDAR